MNIKINRTITEPPKRDYTRRGTKEAAEERLRVCNNLASLQVGESIELTGEGATRDRINGLLAAARRWGIKSSFCTAHIPGGIGVWRVS